MAININNDINIIDSVTNASFTGLSMAGLLLSDSPYISGYGNQMVLSFQNLIQVATYFGTSSLEYTAAEHYFLSFNNSTKLPIFFLIGKLNTVASTSKLVGGKNNSTLVQFQQITSGTLTLEIDGVALPLTNINLSTATSFSDVASLIQTALIGHIAGATVIYDGVFQRFVLDTGNSGSIHSISFADNGILANLLAWQASNGASPIQGGDAQSPADNMDSILNANRNWVSFFLVTDSDTLTLPVTLEFAQWANDQGTQYKFLPYSNNNADKNPTFTGDLGSIILNSQLSNISAIFGDITHAAFDSTITASTDYDATNGTLTHKFKSQPGLLPTVFNDTDAFNLLQKGYNFYGDHASVSQEYIYWQEGTITGKYIFADNFDNQVWLASQLQNSLAILFTNATKIDNNPIGYAIVKGVVKGVMKLCLNNGIIIINNTFDQETTLILTQQAGYDITDYLSSAGYYLQIIPVTPEGRAQRLSPKTTLWYTNGSAIHKLTLNTNLVF